MRFRCSRIPLIQQESSINRPGKRKGENTFDLSQNHNAIQVITLPTALSQESSHYFGAAKLHQQIFKQSEILIDQGKSKKCENVEIRDYSEISIINSSI